MQYWQILYSFLIFCCYFFRLKACEGSVKTSAHQWKVLNISPTYQWKILNISPWLNDCSKLVANFLLMTLNRYFLVGVIRHINLGIGRTTLNKCNEIKINFSVIYSFNKYEEIWRQLGICLHLIKKYLKGKFVLYVGKWNKFLYKCHMIIGFVIN